MIARMETSATAAAATSAPRLRLAKRSLFDPMIVRSALPQSLRKLAPRVQARNPVMLVVLVGAVITTLAFLRDLASSTAQENVFNGLVAAFLWFTVLFANFAEAMAEGRGKAQAAALRKVRSETMANRRTAAGNIESVPSSRLDSTTWWRFRLAKRSRRTARSSKALPPSTSLRSPANRHR
ncbi:ATPase P [Mycobacterium tuberculosis]|nr:ATPase P [Mycobacterium tuberculosis]CKS82179.1 ATPase P [Mycobacterium tuberculosis]